MARKTLIFGNGLGMALDPARFSLDTAIGQVWDSNVLSREQKQLICNCLPDDRAGRPHGEDELDKLQLALSACDFLNGIPGSRIHWLTPEGQTFPDAVRKFVYNTAMAFHQTGLALPNDFVAALIDFVRQTESHIGTLNYDNLLYQPMIEQSLLHGYSGALVDGFHNAGFDASNLERRFGRTFGYYLHLHGSPLFVERLGRTVKLLQRDLPQQIDTVSSHIVLTHFEHKPTVISASNVLLSYWQLLSEAIDESEEIILIGYSGADTHLNSLIRTTSDTPVRIVEWDGAGVEADRMDYWRGQCSRDVSLVRLESILDFREWE
jgi:hypothetical protein